jgi:hypothetical protein
MKETDLAAAEASQGYPDKAILNVTLDELKAAPGFIHVSGTLAGSLYSLQEPTRHKEEHSLRQAVAAADGGEAGELGRALYCGEAEVPANGLYWPSGLRMNFTTSLTGAEGKACLERASWRAAAACRSPSLADSKSRW